MRTALILALAMLAGPAFAAEQTVWKWVDERGVTHYSDRPVPGATRMELNVGSSSSDASPSYGSVPTPASPAAPVGPPYRNFEILQPTMEETIVNTGGVVEVTILVDPPLRPTHTVHLYLDGRLVESDAPNALNYSLTEVPRGEHSVVAVVNDRSGKELQRTETIRFFVRQTSIANPPVGPALRSQPKPARPGANNKLPSRQPTYAALNGERPRIDPVTNAPVKPAPKQQPKTKP